MTHDRYSSPRFINEMTSKGRALLAWSPAFRSAMVDWRLILRALRLGWPDARIRQWVREARKSYEPLPRGALFVEGDTGTSDASGSQALSLGQEAERAAIPIADREGHPALTALFAIARVPSRNDWSKLQVSHLGASGRPPQVPFFPHELVWLGSLWATDVSCLLLSAFEAGVMISTVKRAKAVISSEARDASFPSGGSLEIESGSKTVFAYNSYQAMAAYSRHWQVNRS